MSLLTRWAVTILINVAAPSLGLHRANKFYIFICYMMIPTIHVAAHPWEVLRDYIAGLWMTQRQFADLIGKKQAEVSYILNWDRDINADMAIRLSIVLWTRPEFWLEMQYDYDVFKLNKSDKHKEYVNIENRFISLWLA